VVNIIAVMTLLLTSVLHRRNADLLCSGALLAKNI